MTVIIYSSNRVFREYVTGLLAASSYQLLEVINELEALNAVKKYREALIILDVHSLEPAYSCEALSFLKSINREGYSSNHVVALSWFSASFIFRHTRQHPFYNQYLGKPFRGTKYHLLQLPVEASSFLSIIESHSI